MKKASTLLYLLLVLFLFGTVLQGEDYYYTVTGLYETNAQGQVLKQSSYKGSLLLQSNGTYKLHVHIQDQGNYKYVKANPNQTNDTIYFQSDNNFQFFAYPKENTLAIWAKKSESGGAHWYYAVRSQTAVTPPVASNQTSTENILQLIQKGVFTRTVMYGKTSAPTYLWYNREDGGFTADEGGVILRSNGTFYIKSEIGSSVFKDNGVYRITGTQVALVLSDGSDMTLTLVDGGKSLNWYSQGMLLSEYTLLGFVR